MTENLRRLGPASLVFCEVLASALCGASRDPGRKDAIFGKSQAWAIWARMARLGEAGRSGCAAARRDSILPAAAAAPSSGREPRNLGRDGRSLCSPLTAGRETGIRCWAASPQSPVPLRSGARPSSAAMAAFLIRHEKERGRLGHLGALQAERWR